MATTGFLSGLTQRGSNPGFSELSIVRLDRDFAVNGQVLPAGTAGTVVAVYADGAAYEVEFESPFHAVVTLELTDIRA
jgi:hypothetical protein